VPGTDSYDDENFSRARALFSLEERKCANVAGKKLDQIDHIVLPLIVLQFAGKALTILDFGGGTARALFDLLDYMPGFDFSKLSYLLLETPTMCQAVRAEIQPYVKEKFGTTSFMEVVEDIPASLPNPSIINFNGSIQYIPAYRETLTRLAGLSPNFFVVSGTPIIEEPTCACRHNMRKRVASWKFNRAEFVGAMQDLDYNCIIMFDHDAPPHTHKDSPISSTVSMVFARAQTRLQDKPGNHL
jgi:putative methyltransferase (TIGR04325 family)